MSNHLKAVAFDLDAASLTSLREALPEWEIEELKGTTANSLTHDWSRGETDLLVLKARKDVAETLKMCRFLVYDDIYSPDYRREARKTSGVLQSRQNQARRANAPLLLLVPVGEEALVRAALEAGATSCLVLPVHAKDIASTLPRVEHCNQPGRHTLNLERAQIKDSWRDDGGEG
jgi:hypothetical protein